MRTLAALAAALFLGAATCDDKPKDKEKKPAIPWSKSLEESLKEAKSSKRLVMVDVYADWCGPCKMLDAQTFSDPDVVELCKPMLACKLDADQSEGAKIAEKYQVTGLPTVLFLDGAGEQQGKLIGFMKPDQFMKSTKAILKAREEYPVLMKAHASNPKDCETIVKLCDIFLLRGDKSKAREFAQRAVECAKPGEPGLAKALNEIGDAYQDAEEYEAAISLFEKAAKFGLEAADKAYSMGSIAACYLGLERFDECKEAASKTIGLAGAPSEIVQSCKQMLEAVRRMEEEKAKAEKAGKKQGVEKDSKASKNT